MPTEEQVRSALTSVFEPELGRSVVELGMIRSLQVFEDGRVDVVVSLLASDSPLRSRFEQVIRSQIFALEGTTEVNVGFDALSDDQKQGIQQYLGISSLPQPALSGVTNIVCVGSGKGGVGKSTVTANLATALAIEGKRAAALDADVWGYSIPRMLGVHGKPTVSSKRRIIPLTGPHGVRVISIEYFLQEQDQAIVWRGPMLHKAVRQFLEDVEWGELDYLLIDLPPGTGDIAMTLAQLLPRALFTVVTTPQPAAQKVAGRAAETARRFDLELVGVVENMSGFTTPSGERFTIFGEGGGQMLADELDVPLLGKVPLQEELRQGSDEGRPLVGDDPDAPASQALFHAARGLIAATPQQPAILQTPVAPSSSGGTPLPLA
jgi:ATP-binding protein involved in chromosome partitioning